MVSFKNIKTFGTIKFFHIFRKILMNWQHRQIHFSVKEASAPHGTC